MKQNEKILKAFANRRRLEVIKFLKINKEANVGELSAHLKISFKATSKHLSVLFSADIIEKEQRSLAMYYSLVSQQSSIAKAIISLL